MNSERVNMQVVPAMAVTSFSFHVASLPVDQPDADDQRAAPSHAFTEGRQQAGDGRQAWYPQSEWN